MEVKDPVLGRKVPNIVLLQNQKLLCEALNDKLDNDKLLQENIRVQAQINEFMYTVLKTRELMHD